MAKSEGSFVRFDTNDERDTSLPGYENANCFESSGTIYSSTWCHRP